MSAKVSPALAATRKPGDRELLHAIEHTSADKEWKCSCCGCVLPFQSLDWLNDLSMLLARYAGQLGMTPDIAGLSLIELHGVYLMLERLG